MTAILNNAPASPEPDKLIFPRLEAFSDEPIYNTKAAVRLSGVPAPTLRAWERRYGVLAPERAGNTYRLYSERDVARIRWLREQVERGISIRQAALLLARLENNPAEPPDILAASPAKIAPVSMSPSALPESPRAPGLSLPSLRHDLLQAFLQMDESGAEQVLARALAVYGLEEFCGELLKPVMYELGEKWAQGEAPVTAEHFASAITRAQLTNLLRLAPRNEEAPLVLAGCGPHEHHEIGALMFSLFVRWQGLRVVYLGQNVPVPDFMASVLDMRPVLVGLSCAAVESLGGLLEIVQQINALPPEQQPILSFGGYLFEYHPELAEKLSGHYLGQDAVASARLARSLIQHS